MRYPFSSRKAIKPGARRRAPKPRMLVVAIALAASLATAGYAYGLVYAATDYSWFDGSGSYEVHTAGQLQALSNLVDGTWQSDPVALGTTGDDAKARYALPATGRESLVDGAHSFVGERVSKTGALDFLGRMTIKPIGDAEHPFDGAFDGNGHDVGNLAITNVAGKASDKVSGTQYVGLFGHVGPHGSVSNLVLGRGCAIDIQATRTSDHVAYVGSVAGWCEGSIENVTSQAAVSVTWDDGAGGDGRCAEGDYTNAYVVDGVGGIAGYCDGDVSGSTFKGGVSVYTPANATWVEASQSSAANVVRYVGGVVGRSGGDPSGAGVSGDAASRGTLTDCSNKGDVSVTTTGAGGTDRFGEKVDSKSLYVGGVAGYAIGDVSGCSNTGNIVATSHAWDDGLSYDDNRKAQYASDGGADGIGGIVGGLRSATSDGNVHADPDDIAAAKAPFTVEGITVDRGIAGKVQTGRASVVQVSGCTNLGIVIGCNNVGGIAGATGTYTRLVGCANGDAARYLRDDTVGRVVSVRWNKPMTGGLVGRCMGDVCYSRNHGEVTTTKGGYYVGGLVGDLYYYRDSLNGKFVTPEVYACYNTGQIGTSITFRRGALLGGSGGYVHDCLYLFGTATASEDESVAAIGQEKAEDEPTKARLSVAYASDAQAAARGAGAFGMKSSRAVAWLNNSAMRADPVDGKTGWETGRYYMATPSLNSGYPVLYSADAIASSAIDLSLLDPDIALVEDATYTSAFNPTPKLRVAVNVDGGSRELVENADYYVVPDPNAVDGNGVCRGATGGARIYTAGVRGIAGYAGGVIAGPRYAIGKGDFSECTVNVPARTFTNEEQAPGADEVTVLDSAGNRVDPVDYTVRVNDGAPCREPGSYKVVASAGDGSNYVGDAAGTFAIAKVDIARDCDVIGITYDEATDGGASDVQPGVPEVWLYDDETYKLYQVAPIVDGGTGQIATYGEEDLPALRAGATDADGNALPEASLPTDEVVRGYLGYPKVEGFEVYRDEDGGRWLTRADKVRDAEGSLPEPSFEYTAAEIRPQVIGVNWARGKLSFAQDAGAAVPAWRAIYGGGAGGSTSSVGSSADSGTLNVEASATGAVTVVTHDAYSTYVRNYDVMTFDIAPAAVKLEERGVFSAAMSDQFRVFKEGDPLVPQVVVTYRGNAVDSSNYTLSIDDVVDASGVAVLRRSRFVEGDTVFYKVAFKKTGSILWDGELTADPNGDLLSCTVVKDKLPLSSATVSVEFTGDGWKSVDGVWEKTYTLEEGIDLPAVSVTDVSTGRVLVEGVDYQLSYDTVNCKYPGYRYASEDELAYANMGYSPMVTVRGLNGFTGNYKIYYRVNKGRLSQEQLREIAGASGDEQADSWFANRLGRVGARIAERGHYYSYRPHGYTADDFSRLVALVFRYRSATGRGVNIENFLLKVTGIMDSDGRFVETALAPGVYHLAVAAPTDQRTYGKFSPSSNRFFDVDEDATADIPIEIVPVNLSGNVHVCDAGSFFVDMMDYGSLRLMPDTDNIDLAKYWVYRGNVYPYTGNPVKPRYMLLDTCGATYKRGTISDADGTTHLETDDQVCARVMKHAFAFDNYDVLVDGYESSGGPVEVGTSYQVVGLRAAANSVLLEGSRQIQATGLAVNTFSIIAADISDTSVVGIRVGEGDGKGGRADVGYNVGYLGADGARPKVHFFVDADGVDGDGDGSLFDCDEECAYVEGEDYEVEYLDNDDVSPAGERTAIARIWVKDSRHLSAAANGEFDLAHVGWHFDVPFAVEGRQVTLNDPDDVAWDVSKQLAVGTDGKLSEPAARATYRQDTGSGGLEDVPVPEGAYRLAVGARGADDMFAEVADGDWKPGDTACIAVQAGDMNRFVVDGERSAIVAEAEVVAPSEANDFTSEGFPYEMALSQQSYTYGAVPREPAVTIVPKGGGEGGGLSFALVEGRDFAVEYADNVGAGAARAVVRGIGGFTGQRELAFSIGKLGLGACKVAGADKGYAGAPIELAADEVQVTFDGASIPAQAGWEVVPGSWADNEDAGAATFAVRAVEGGNLTGGTNGTFRIIGRSLADEACQAASEQPVMALAEGATALSREQFADGDVIVTDAAAGGRRLVLGRDFDIAGIANADGYVNAAGSSGGVVYVGYATLTLVGAGNYSGAITVDVPIQERSLAAAVLSFADEALSGNGSGAGELADKYCTYTGKELKPPVTVSLGGLELREGVDYALRYADNVDAGTARIVAVGLGVYRGSQAEGALEFEIEPYTAPEGVATFELAARELPYGGRGQEPVGTLTVRGERVAAKYVELAYASLAEGEEGRDGEPAATPLGEGELPAEPGLYRVTATATGGNVRGSASAELSIVAADLADCTLKLGPAVATWPGDDPALPDVAIVTRLGAELPLAESGCTASYRPSAGSWKPGEIATVEVTGDGARFGGSAEASYEVARVPIMRGDVDFADGAQLAATGDDVVPDIAVNVAGRKLVAGVDYTIEPLTPDLKSAGIKVLEIKTPADGFYVSDGVQVQYEVVDGEPDVTPGGSGKPGGSGDSSADDSGEEGAGSVDPEGGGQPEPDGGPSAGEADEGQSGEATSAPGEQQPGQPQVPAEAAGSEPSVPAGAVSAANDGSGASGIAVKVGDTVGGVAAPGGVSFDVKVTSAGTVTLVGCDAEAGSSLTVNTVKISGKIYKVTAIAAGAFAGTKAFNVKVGPNVKAIGARAFAGASSLKSAAIGDNVASVGKSAFSGCKRLSSVTLGKRVKKVGRSAFSGCRKLKALKVLSAKLTKKAVKGSLKGSSVKTVSLAGAAKKKLDAYRACFKKANSGKSVRVRVSGAKPASNQVAKQALATGAIRVA